MATDGGISIPAGMAFDETGLRSFIEQGWKRYSQGDNALFQRIDKRRQHFYLQAPPVLPEPWSREDPEQWRGIKDSYVEVLTRLCENPWVCRITAVPDTADGKKRADEAEAVTNDGVRLFERRAGVNLQRELATAMYRDCYGVLKTTLAKDIYPAIPEAEVYDTLPEGTDEKRFKQRYREVEGEDGKPRRQRYYEETVEALRERGRNQKARAGWPWYHEVVDAATVAFGEDRGIAEGPAWAIQIRVVGLIEYHDSLKDEGSKLRVSLAEENKKIRIYEETDAPPVWGPSRAGYEHLVGVCEVWTRDEFYELVSDAPVTDGALPAAVGWQVVKADRHPYGRVPYFKAVAFDTAISDPALRWLPIADRLYDAKPALDRILELSDVLAERFSLNEVYLVNENTGALLMRDDGSGDPVILSAESLGSYQVPAGYKPMSIERRVDPAFTRQVDQKLEMAERSRPSSGRAEGTTGTSQPWTVNQLQSQENIEPSFFSDNMSACFRENAGMMVGMMSDETLFPDGVWVYASGKYASKEKGTLVGISAGEGGSLDVDVDIAPTTAAQRITVTEFQRTLLNDPNWPLTPLEALERTGEENPSKKIADWYAWKAVVEQFIPAFTKQVMVALAGDMVFAGVNGQPIGPGGVPVNPQQVAQMGQPGPNQPGGPVGQAQSPPGWLAREPILRAMRPTALMPGSPAPPSNWGNRQ